MKEVAINYKGLEIISYEKFLNTSDADRIFASALNDQNSAQVIIDPNSNSKGFWFGGGNIIFHIAKYNDV